ncbi:hypothetical protein Y032_0267g741 [Ancylostoma ceylanicum]|uniref:Reverse transcriptase domain-containing protein n=1 Tax=Ancylostoma ceylanicum TaxID=53326 RepID=A0A016S953_9BILA|nr:hypothetical protein Y032_0267g741 [Ancylostoma ceylanicum]
MTASVDEFLTNREFMVRVNSSFSKPRLACSGVPQGAVLPPIPFNIYTYDLAEAASSTRGSADKLTIARPRKRNRRRFFVYRAGADYERLSKNSSFLLNSVRLRECSTRT